MKTITISLPDELAKQIQDFSKHKGFATRSEFFRTAIRAYFDSLPALVFSPTPLESVRQDLSATNKYTKEFIDKVVDGLSQSSVYANPPAEGRASKISSKTPTP